MRIRTAVLACAALVAAGSYQAHAEIDDGSFEAAVSNTLTSNSNWVLTADNPTAGLAAQFQAGFAASDGDNGVWFKPFVGSSASPVSATLTQTIPNVTAGDYTLFFDAAREANFSAASWTATFSSSSGPLDALDLNAAVFNLPSNMFANPTTFSLQLGGVASGEDLTITVAMVDGTQALANPQSALVDNFRLRFVPEPASVVLLLPAAALLVMRRRH